MTSREDIQSLVTEELLALPFADQIMVFGSFAGANPAPADIDVFIDLRNTPDTSPSNFDALLRLARRYYGWLDPFLRTQNGLLSRNPQSTSWTKAKQAIALSLAMDKDGQPLSSCWRLRQQAFSQPNGRPQPN